MLNALCRNIESISTSCVCCSCVVFMGPPGIRAVYCLKSYGPLRGVGRMVYGRSLLWVICGHGHMNTWVLMCHHTYITYMSTSIPIFHGSYMGSHLYLFYYISIYISFHTSLQMRAPEPHRCELFNCILLKIISTICGKHTLSTVCDCIGLRCSKRFSRSRVSV